MTLFKPETFCLSALAFSEGLGLPVLSLAEEESVERMSMVRMVVSLNMVLILIGVKTGRKSGFDLIVMVTQSVSHTIQK